MTPKMTCNNYIYLFITVTLIMVTKAKEDLRDFSYSSEPEEMMIAQESRSFRSINEPIKIIKPNGITNSHRPQYNLDSYEGDDLIDLEDIVETTTRRAIVKHYKSSNKIRSKEGAIRDAVLKAFERKDHVGKFAQILPIVRAMSGSQRLALASLVANQVSTPPGRQPLNFAQVRSMFGNNANTTTDLMLPILLDMANLVRRAVRSGKVAREVKQPLPKAQLLRRSFNIDDDTALDDEPFDVGTNTTETTKYFRPVTQKYNLRQRISTNNKSNKPSTVDATNRNITPNSKTDIKHPVQDTTKEHYNNLTTEITADVNIKSFNRSVNTESNAHTAIKPTSSNQTLSDAKNLDLTADATNQTLVQDLPVAEKLRALNRYVDRKGNIVRRANYPLKPSTVTRRTTAEPTLSAIRRRPMPARKLPQSPMAPAEQAKCELFTNTLCLHAEDYPTEAIVQTIRRNKAAASALLADFRDPGEGAVDGVTAAQEAKYTADHYLVSNRRGDIANRDFAGAGEAGFMCPSTVKYARPQRARATSGQWKYIVNTGEHTQTLRLEKCLKPKESCTYLTDNFKSKCVQVYNYHRLLTWDQQNGLHMDIFKVPTCCSCHIEGYSVSFPPLGHRIHETSSENLSGDDVSSEKVNNAFESVQSSIQIPTINKIPSFLHNKHLESSFTNNHNLISGSSFANGKINDNEDFKGNVPLSNPMDSYGNTYFPDSFNQATSVRNIKRPPSSRNPIVTNNFDSVTLPSYLEPPTPLAPSGFFIEKDTQNKYKIAANHFKRGASRPNRRPIRKKISGGSEDLVSSGTSAIESSLNNGNTDIVEINSEEADFSNKNDKIIPTRRPTIGVKLHAITTEVISTTSKSTEKSKSIKDVITSTGKKVNYNYHPIIDFFEEDDKEMEEDSIDREDSVSAYVPSLESEWKPINHPPSRNSQTTNIIGRKKLK